MVKNSMANNPKTVRVNGSRYRQVPGFTNYGISAFGVVIYLTTGYCLTPKDFNHGSGRVSLYKRDKHGNKIQRTMSIDSLMKATYSKNWINQLQTMEV